MSLKERLKAETQEAEQKQYQIEKDPNRLALHLMPPVGWINDPNGLCQFNGEYHVFYQYSPLDPNASSIKVWGHYVSKDQIHWKQLEVPFFPDEEFDRNGVYSGSAFVEKNRMHIFYTGNVKKVENDDTGFAYSGREANTVLVTSEDGVHFSEKKLLMTNADYPKAYTCHIRDPKVWKQCDKYYMIQGGRKKAFPENGADKNAKCTDYGTVLIFESEDLVHWSFFKDVTSEKRFGYMWECPDYFTVDGQALLSLSPQGLAHEQYRYQNVYSSGYFLLDSDIVDSDSAVAVDTERFFEWDMGFDFYAPQTFCDEKGRRILIGWAGIVDADYDNQPTVDMGWQHALTLPREITWSAGKIHQNPLEEFAALRGSEEIPEQISSTVSPVFELMLSQFDADCFIRVGSREDAFTLSYKDGVLTFALCGDAGHGRKNRQVRMAELRNLRLIVDTSLVEIYANDGETVITSRFYFKDDRRDLEIHGAGKRSLWYLKGLEVTK